MIKVALIGYGKMGKAIEGVIEKEYAGSMEVIHRIDENSTRLLEKDELTKADVAIEFTTPHTALNNIYKCFEAHVPVVVGSTGWYSKFEEVKSTCLKNNQALFTASNFSVGVNIFFEVNKALARFMNSRAEYSATMTEIHHTEKKDAPSGTGITLAEGVLGEMNRYEKWVNHEAADKSELPIISLREPNVPGTHIVQYNSEIDFIRIEHTAHSRLGFAQGAVMAAQWLVGKHGVFGMKDLLQINNK
jgi:4-hydroxy-tetrahydrodipicolinate reductase